MRKRSEAGGVVPYREPAPRPADPVSRDEELEILAKAEQVIADASKPPPLFVSPNKGTGGLAPDMERIIETVYSVDAAKEYAELEQNLEIGEDRGDLRTLQRHLDKAEDRARRAHKLFLAGRLEKVKWELDAEVVSAGMRKKAIDDLEADKAAGRSKRVTNDDVDARVSEMFVDEHRAQKIKREQLKGMVEALERLADLWKQRCFTLSSLLSNLRK